MVVAGDRWIEIMAQGGSGKHDPKYCVCPANGATVRRDVFDPGQAAGGVV